MGLDLHPARPATSDEQDYWGNWYYEPDWPHPQWSYGGFSRFRERLAKTEGFDLDEMRGFGGTREWDTVSTELEPLLNHSDCDGEMSPADCLRVYPRLEQVIADWKARADAADYYYDVRSGEALVAAMKLVATRHLTLIFR